MTSQASRIMVIRHAEKPAATGAPYGIDTDGAQDNESLIVRGWQRAGALAALFAPSDGQYPSTALAQPQFLYASAAAKHSHSLRPQETITPLSAKIGVNINSAFAKGDAIAMANNAMTCNGIVLIAWEHQDIPAIGNTITGNSTTVPQTWPGERFDLVWVFVWNSTTEKYLFSQVPQCLLAGDLPTPIS